MALVGDAMNQSYLGAIIGLAATVAGCTVAHRIAVTPLAGRTKLDVNRLQLAIERIESGGRNCEPYWDVNGYAWGLYGMHMPRWCEIGGKAATWGKASPEEQRRLFRKALSKRAGSFEAVARWHNGTGRAHYEYARKLQKEYERIK